MTAEKSCAPLCTPTWFSSVYPCYTVICGNMTCVAMCYVTLWLMAYGLWQQVCKRHISWKHNPSPPPPSLFHCLPSFIPLTCFHLSPFPPELIFCFILLLSNYLYLTQSHSGQHGWPVSCQQSKWGISWPFHCSHQIPSKDSPQWSQNTAVAFMWLLPSYSTH